MESGSLWFGESRPWGPEGKAKLKRSVIQREAPPTGMGPENEGGTSPRPGCRKDHVTRGDEPASAEAKRCSEESTPEQAETEHCAYGSRMNFTEFSPQLLLCTNRHEALGSTCL